MKSAMSRSNGRLQTWYSVDSKFEKENERTGYIPQILTVVIAER